MWSCFDKWRLSMAAAILAMIWTSDLNAQMAAHNHQHGNHEATVSHPAEEMASPQGLHNHQHSSPEAGLPHTGKEMVAAHGGQMTTVGQLCFEVVYRPKETRVYLFGADHRPVSARGVQAQLAMRVPGNEKWFRFPLRHVAADSETAGDDYLAAAVDVSRIRDGRMTVAFQLKNLANSQEPEATFRQTFALSKLTVTVAAIGPSDNHGIAEQKVCPVLGGQLGAMGAPIKVLVGGDPIFLCCQGCLNKVQANPEAYLEKVKPSQSNASSSTSSKVTVGPATPSDQAAVYLQGKCPVMGTTLGSHGNPIKVSTEKKTLFVCCQGCIGTVKSDPNKYLVSVAESRLAQ